MTGAEVEIAGRYLGQADVAIDGIEKAANALAACVSAEQRLEDERPLVKSAAIQRLMQQTNPETGKPHSASSAEKVVESDDEYITHRMNQRFAAEQTISVRGQYEAAKRRADLALEMVRLHREASRG